MASTGRTAMLLLCVVLISQALWPAEASYGLYHNRQGEAAREAALRVAAARQQWASLGRYGYGGGLDPYSVDGYGYQDYYGNGRGYGVNPYYSSYY